MPSQISWYYKLLSNNVMWKYSAHGPPSAQLLTCLSVFAISFLRVTDIPCSVTVRLVRFKQRGFSLTLQLLLEMLRCPSLVARNCPQLPRLAAVSF